VANKTYSVSVKFNAHTATDVHAINARLFVMLWESPATIYDAAECEIVGISLEVFDSGHFVVNAEQSEKIETYIISSLEMRFEKNKTDYYFKAVFLGDDTDRRLTGGKLLELAAQSDTSSG
jgi:hypothetical protein